MNYLRNTLLAGIMTAALAVPAFGQQSTRDNVVYNLRNAGYDVQIGETKGKQVLHMERISKTEGSGILGIRNDRKEQCDVEYVSALSIAEKEGWGILQLDLRDKTTSVKDYLENIYIR